MFIQHVGLTGSGPLRDAVAKAGLLVDDLGSADLVLVEDPTEAALEALDAATPGHAILALLGDDVAVTELADATGRPELVLGFRLAGDRLAEIIEGEDTVDAAAQAAAGFAQAIRRQAVRTVVPIAGRVDSLEAACEHVESGFSTIREVDLASRMSGGPAFFADADAAGLEATDDSPTLLRRLVAQGRTGRAAGQGFYAYAPEGDGPVISEVRDGVTILWLSNPPANSLTPTTIEAMAAAWAKVETSAAIIASANPALFCAGADIKAFQRMDAAAGAKLIDEVHTLVAEFEASRTVTIAAVNGLAFGGGCELAMACDVRIAALSATFGQPEINLGIIPGFGGTQWLPRLVGTAKALEMNLSGEAISSEDAFAHGLVNRIVEDHGLFDTALAWARKLGGQAPVAVEQIKRVSGRGMDAEKEGFGIAFTSEDGREGVAAFVEKRKPEWKGK